MRAAGKQTKQWPQHGSALAPALDGAGQHAAEEGAEMHGQQDPRARVERGKRCDKHTNTRQEGQRFASQAEGAVTQASTRDCEKAEQQSGS